MYAKFTYRLLTKYHVRFCSELFIVLNIVKQLLHSFKKLSSLVSETTTSYRGLYLLIYTHFGLHSYLRKRCDSWCARPK